MDYLRDPILGVLAQAKAGFASLIYFFSFLHFMMQASHALNEKSPTLCVRLSLAEAEGFAYSF